MRFYSTDVYGQTLMDPGPAARRNLLKSVLEPDSDVDYAEVYLTHRDGPTVSYRDGGDLLKEDLNGKLSLLRGVDSEFAALVWEQLACEQWDALEAHPWTQVSLDEEH
jgi:hypothetical protein